MKSGWNSKRGWGASGSVKVYGVLLNRTNGTTVRTDDAVGMSIEDFKNVRPFNKIFDVIEDGNYFTALPAVYIRKVKTATTELIQVSEKPIKGGSYLPATNWDFVAKKVIPYFYFGRFLGAEEAGKLVSKPNKYPLAFKNIVQCRDLAKANGPGYQQHDIHAHDLITTLLDVILGVVNHQTVYRGYDSGRYSADDKATVAESSTNRFITTNAIADRFRVGQGVAIGTSVGSPGIANERKITSIITYNATQKAIVFDGAPVNVAVNNVLWTTGFITGWSSPLYTGAHIANDGNYPFAFFGIESPYADHWQFADGVNINNNQAWVCKDPAQYASNLFAAPYEQLSYINMNANGNIQELGLDTTKQFAQFPVAVGLNNYGDYYFQDTGQRIALVGGCRTNGSNDGARYWNLSDSSSNANGSFGGRVHKKLPASRGTERNLSQKRT